MEERYIRNIPAISEEQQLALADRSALIIGCGGLGGYVVEELARIGVGHITVTDGDVFNESNLNRQLFCTAENIGQSKAEAATERIRIVNPDVELTAIAQLLSISEISELVEKADVVVDALDNVRDRLVLEDICKEKMVPLVHGAIQGWNLQVGLSTPGSELLHRLYGTASQEANDPSSAKTSLCSTVACCASMEVAEAVKVLTGQESELAGKLFLMDLRTFENYII